MDNLAIPTAAVVDIRRCNLSFCGWWCNYRFRCQSFVRFDRKGERQNRRTPIVSCVLGSSNQNIPPALPLPCGYCAISTAMVMNDSEEDGGDEIMKD